MRPADRIKIEPGARGVVMSVELFKGVEPQVRAELLSAGRVRRFAKDAMPWTDDQRIRFVYVILSGRVGICDIADGETTVLDLFQPGDVIAGGLVLTDLPSYVFSGKAVEDVEALTIPIGLFRRRVRQSHALLFATALNIVRQWRQVMLQVRSPKQLSATQRLGFYLLALTDAKSGTATVHLVDDQLLIAGIIGVTRESLSRCLAQLEAHGVMKRGRRVTLMDVARLRAFCENGRV